MVGLPNNYFEEGLTQIVILQLILNGSTFHAWSVGGHASDSKRPEPPAAGRGSPDCERVTTRNIIEEGEGRSPPLQGMLGVRRTTTRRSEQGQWFDETDSRV